MVTGGPNVGGSTGWGNTGYSSGGSSGSGGSSTGGGFSGIGTGGTGGYSGFAPAPGSQPTGGFSGVGTGGTGGYSGVAGSGGIISGGSAGGVIGTPVSGIDATQGTAQTQQSVTQTQMEPSQATQPLASNLFHGAPVTVSTTVGGYFVPGANANDAGSWVPGQNVSKVLTSTTPSFYKGAYSYDEGFQYAPSGRYQEKGGVFSDNYGRTTNLFGENAELADSGGNALVGANATAHPELFSLAPGLSFKNLIQFSGEGGAESVITISGEKYKPIASSVSGGVVLESVRGAEFSQQLEKDLTGPKGQEDFLQILGEQRREIDVVSSAIPQAQELEAKGLIGVGATAALTRNLGERQAAYTTGLESYNSNLASASAFKQAIVAEAGQPVYATAKSVLGVSRPESLPLSAAPSKLAANVADQVKYGIVGVGQFGYDVGAFVVKASTIGGLERSYQLGSEAVKEQNVGKMISAATAPIWNPFAVVAEDTRGAAETALAGIGLLAAAPAFAGTAIYTVGKAGYAASQGQLTTSEVGSVATLGLLGVAAHGVGKVSEAVFKPRPVEFGGGVAVKVYGEEANAPATVSATSLARTQNLFQRITGGKGEVIGLTANIPLQARAIEGGTVAERAGEGVTYSITGKSVQPVGGVESAAVLTGEGKIQPINIQVPGFSKGYDISSAKFAGESAVTVGEKTIISSSQGQVFQLPQEFTQAPALLEAGNAKAYLVAGRGASAELGAGEAGILLRTEGGRPAVSLAFAPKGGLEAEVNAPYNVPEYARVGVSGMEAGTPNKVASELVPVRGEIANEFKGYDKLAQEKGLNTRAIVRTVKKNEGPTVPGFGGKFGGGDFDKSLPDKFKFAAPEAGRKPGVQVSAPYDFDLAQELKELNAPKGGEVAIPKVAEQYKESAAAVGAQVKAGLDVLVRERAAKAEPAQAFEGVAGVGVSSLGRSAVSQKGGMKTSVSGAVSTQAGQFSRELQVPAIAGTERVGERLINVQDTIGRQFSNRYSLTPVETQTESILTRQAPITVPAQATQTQTRTLTTYAPPVPPIQIGGGTTPPWIPPKRKGFDLTGLTPRQPRPKAGKSVYSERGLYSDLFSAARSYARYGSITQPSLKKRPGLWRNELVRVPTVELIKKGKNSGRSGLMRRFGL